MKYLCLILLIFVVSCSHKTPPSLVVPSSPSHLQKIQYDTDGDGIGDDVDKCPNVPGVAKYQGCPVPDTDGDGIEDELVTEKKVTKSNRIKDEPNFIESYNIKKREKKNYHISKPYMRSITNPGRLVYHIPDTMVSFKTYTIKIRISRDTSNRVILQNMAKVIDTIIKSTSSMEILIMDPSTSKSFEITKVNSERQIVDDEGYTEWQYDVTPLKSGKLQLSLVVSIIRDGDKKQIVYMDNIYVESNTPVAIEIFLSKNWQWIVSTIITSILTPILFWWYKKRRRRRSEKIL